MADQIMQSSFDSVLLMKMNDAAMKYAGILALVALFSIYMQAAIQGDLQTNPDWTISRVMVYPSNAPIAKHVLFPCFLTICLMYAAKHYHSYRIQAGAVVAVVGGIGLIIYPVTAHEKEHIICAAIVFLSSGFWFPECTGNQFKTFALSSVFFIGGFAMAFLVDESESEISYMSFVPSACCAIGELGIFTTWGVMVRNDKSDNKNKII